MAEKIWKIELFGRLRVGRGSGDAAAPVVTRFRTKKTGALLAYLAFYRDRVHAREPLCELLWPDAPEKTQRNNLNMALSSLRRQLEPPPLPARSVIVADPATVRLNPAAVTTDVAEFEAALRQAGQARGAAERAGHLEEAVALYGGDLSVGFYDDWIVSEQERLRDRFLQALEELLSHWERVGDTPRALACARRAMRGDPEREAFHHTLIRLLAATGRTAEALRQFAECERALAAEGDAPSPELRALIGQIGQRTHRAPVVAAAPAPSSREAIGAPALPAGTVTFLWTDVEGSTAFLERGGEAARAALERHHRLLRAEFVRHDGQEAKEMGDGFLVAFAHARRALACAVAGQRALEAPDAVKVRMVLHSGDIAPGADGGYHGLLLHHGARMLGAGHGGQILCSEATAALLRREVGEEEVTLRDLGVYRLRDVPEGERLFQVCYPGMARSEFPPPAALPARTAHLPPTFTRFFGREGEIARLTELLLSPAMPARLVTLTGPGGTGKTRLAIEAAQRLRAPMAEAVWFAELADLSDARLLPDAVRDALRLPRLPGQDSALEQIVEALSAQPALLVLDNCEHLIEEGAVPFVQTLRTRVPTLICLLTSRQRLNLPGEGEMVLAPLPVPGRADQPERLIRYESVQLLVERAQAVRADFQITPGNAPDVAELCAKLEGIPLAIELAAARAGVLTPRQMLVRMEKHPFDLLVDRRRSVEARHRTMRAVIDWSYGLLSPRLQRFWVRLSVFRGGWTAEAAQAVCAEPAPPPPHVPSDAVLDYLSELRECSLIQAEESVEGYPGGVMRFRMLETLRQYAAERLVESGEAEGAQRRHRDFFLALAEEAEPELQGPDQAQWLDRLETEHDNFRAALTRPEAVEVHLQLAGALHWFWMVRGHLTEGRRWLEGALAGIDKGCGALSDALWAQSLNAAGVLAWSAADLVAGRRHFEDSLEIFRRMGGRGKIASALNNLGIVASQQADYATARRYYEESLAIYRELGAPRRVASVLSNLGAVALEQGDNAAARRYLEESLPIQRDLQDTFGLANTLLNLGEAACNEGRDAQARALLGESLSLRCALGDRNYVAATLLSLAAIARRRGDAEGAVRLLGAAEAAEENCENPLAPGDRAKFDDEVAAARSGMDAETFAAAWVSGRSMPLEQIVQDALAPDALDPP